MSTPHISCDGRWRHSLQCSLHTQYITSVYYEFTPLHAQNTHTHTRTHTHTHTHSESLSSHFSFLQGKRLAPSLHLLLIKSSQKLLCFYGNPTSFHTNTRYHRKYIQQECPNSWFHLILINVDLSAELIKGPNRQTRPSLGKNKLWNMWYIIVTRYMIISQHFPTGK